MTNRIPARPNFADKFRCIGSACEDTCCKDWTIPIDRATCEKYAALPPSPLRTLIESSIAISPAAAGQSSAAQFATIRLNDTQHCPMLSGEGLCRIHAECGPEFLAYTCATYPRIVHSLGAIEDKALTLSCPEAARAVLFDRDLMKASGSDTADPEPPIPLGPCSLSHFESAPSMDLRAWFWPIRKSVFAMVLNRAYPLWQRMFLLTIFCRRLDGIAAGEINRSVPDFLHDFDETVASGALRDAMETLPLDAPSQLDVVLRLAGMLLTRSLRGPRFTECVHAFTTGIGNGPGATLESLSDQYSLAHDRYFAPFFDRNPHILENYLINTIIRCVFPFGREGMQPGAKQNLTRECATLVAQFALMKGLLIGVAGFHKQNFAPEHVIHTVQAASRHFEHHPEFLKMTHALLVESRMDGARGLSILLRNTAPVAPHPIAPSVPVAQASNIAHGA